jgi:hypothetical protein
VCRKNAHADAQLVEEAFNHAPFRLSRRLGFVEESFMRPLADIKRAVTVSEPKADVIHEECPDKKVVMSPDNS